MWGIICIFVFTILLAFPGFYIITRKVFPKKSKRFASLLSAVTTALFIMLMGAMLLGTTL
ncbi:hypothetical protein [Candidatus Avelusimicrobium sp.]